ncbi:MAG TPA: OmpH family outer membrane protein [Candidatus Angelobacter sp.]
MLVPSKTTLSVISRTVLLVSTACFGQATAAVSAPASVPSKIAFVNLQEAVVTCNEGKQEAATLMQRFSGKQSALKAQDDELKKLKDDFQAVSAKLNEEERAARAKVIQDKQKVFDRSFADYQAETQEAQQEAVGRIVKKMLPVLEKYVASNGYTAVFDVSNPQSAPVLWIRKDAMITRQIVEAYNAESGIAAPTPGTTGTAVPPKP